MVEKVNPSINRPIAAFKTAGAIALAGGSSEGWISRVGQATDISVEDADITAANLDAFEETSSSGSLSVTIDGGEAFVYGAWLAKDDSTTVSLSPSTSGQTVYVGWNKGGTDDVIVGLDSAFSDASGDKDEKLPLFTYDTDGSGVTAVSDERQLGKYIEADTANLETLEADNATIGGVDVPDGILDTRNAVNQLFIDNARQDFELGLTILEMDDGQFEVYVNDARIANQSNVDLSLGSTLNGNGTVSLSSGATEGFTEHDKEDYGFLPDSVWVTDDIDTNPTNGTIEYEIEDENGNVFTVTQSETESSVDVSGTIETYGVTTRAVLKRDTDGDTSPVLDAYSAYISGQTPDDYLEARVTGVAEA